MAFRRRPAGAGLAVYVPKPGLARLELEHTENDGQRKTPRADRARIEDSDAAVQPDERNMRVAADEDIGGHSLGEPCGIGPQPGAVYADVKQQDAKDRLTAFGVVLCDDVDLEYVRQIGPAHVDVAPHGRERGDVAQGVEHGQIADISGVQDRVGSLGCDEAQAVRVRATVCVGNHGEP